MAGDQETPTRVFIRQGLSSFRQVWPTTKEDVLPRTGDRVVLEGTYLGGESPGYALATRGKFDDMHIDASSWEEDFFNRDFFGHLAHEAEEAFNQRHLDIML